MSRKPIVIKRLIKKPIEINFLVNKFNFFNPNKVIKKIKEENIQKTEIRLIKLIIL